MDRKKEYIHRMNTKLDQWSGEIYVLSTKADKIEVRDRTKYSKQIEELLSKRISARKRLQVLEQANDGIWEEMKTEIEMTWDSINDEISLVKSRIK